MCTLKILTDLCYTKQRTKTKYFFKSCLECCSSKNVLTEDKEVCFSISGAQSVTLEKGTINSKVVLNKYHFRSKFMLMLSVL